MRIIDTSPYNRARSVDDGEFDDMPERKVSWIATGQLQIADVVGLGVLTSVPPIPCSFCFFIPALRTTEFDFASPGLVPL